MNDTELVELIANVWVMNGEDAIGFDWLVDKIRDRIEKNEGKVVHK